MKCGRQEAGATLEGVTCFHVVQTATVTMMVVGEMNGVIYHSSMGMAIDRTSSRAAMCRLEQRQKACATAMWACNMYESIFHVK